MGGAFEPTEPGSPAYMQGGSGELEAEDGILTEERMAGLLKLCLTTTPTIFKKPWLATDEEDLQPLTHELTIYCRNHDLDPSEYFGDYFPVVICALPIAAGIVTRHQEHKKESKTEEVERTKHETPITTTTAPHTPVETIVPVMNATSAGGDNLAEVEMDDPGDGEGDIDG